MTTVMNVYHVAINVELVKVLLVTVNHVPMTELMMPQLVHVTMDNMKEMVTVTIVTSNVKNVPFLLIIVNHVLLTEN